MDHPLSRSVEDDVAAFPSSVLFHSRRHSPVTQQYQQHEQQNVFTFDLENNLAYDNNPLIANSPAYERNQEVIDPHYLPDFRSNDRFSNVSYGNRMISKYPDSHNPFSENDSPFRGESHFSSAFSPLRNQPFPQTPSPLHSDASIDLSAYPVSHFHSFPTTPTRNLFSSSPTLGTPELSHRPSSLSPSLLSNCGNNSLQLRLPSRPLSHPRPPPPPPSPTRLAPLAQNSQFGQDHPSTMEMPTMPTMLTMPTRPGSQFSSLSSSSQPFSSHPHSLHSYPASKPLSPLSPNSLYSQPFSPSTASPDNTSFSQPPTVLQSQSHILSHSQETPRGSPERLACNKDTQRTFQTGTPPRELSQSVSVPVKSRSPPRLRTNPGATVIKNDNHNEISSNENAIQSSSGVHPDNHPCTNEQEDHTTTTTTTTTNPLSVPPPSSSITTTATSSSSLSSSSSLTTTTTTTTPVMPLINKITGSEVTSPFDPTANASSPSTKTKRRAHSGSPQLKDGDHKVNLEDVNSGKDKRTTLMIKNIPNA